MKYLYTTFLVMVCASGLKGQLNYQAEKEKLHERLTQRPISTHYKSLVDEFYHVSCDSLLQAYPTVDGDPMESVLLRLFGATQMQLDRRSITTLRIPSLNANFLQLLNAYRKVSILPLLREIGIARTRILATAFVGLPIGDTLAMAVNLREVVSFPHLAPSRIHDPLVQPYADTLLHFFRNQEPKLFITELNRDPEFLRLVEGSVRKGNKALLLMKNEQNLDRLLPFSMAIMEKRTTIAEVINKSSRPSEYIRAYTNEVLHLRNSPDPQDRSFLDGFLKQRNEDLSRLFVDPINQLHTAPDKDRFFVLKDLSAQELYFVILGGESVFYTSSFLYTFNEFMKKVRDEGLGKFLERIDHYEFGEFLSICAAYGMTADVMRAMDEEKLAVSLLRYIERHVNSDQSDRAMILHGMTIAEILSGLRGYSKAQAFLMKEMEEKQIRARYADILVQRMYAGFSDILEDSIQGKLREIREMYSVMEVERLKKNDTIVQVGLFYDDEDGASSFANYLSSFKSRDWERTDHENYVTLRSKKGNIMYVHLNKPNTEAGDKFAQDEMLKAVADSGQEITNFTHRGHSYHLHKSMKRMPETAELVFLGSCGGYNEVVSVFQANPDAQIISTRNIGSKLINDPILSEINRLAIDNKDINWNDLWEDFSKQFKNRKSKELFGGYIPPNRYIGIMFIRQVFNY